MKELLKKQFSVLFSEMFLVSFLFLVGSFFLEFFFPGLIAYYLHPAWIFLFTCGAGLLSVLSMR